MSTILKLRGARALSDFRLAKLLPQLKAVHSGVQALAAEFRHFVELPGPPDSDESKLLDKLLSYGARLESSHAGDHMLLVVPRIGTISPWSSKATDIARQCGLPSVRRIERGTACFLKIAGRLKTGERAALAAVLHDRMTETVLASEDEADALSWKNDIIQIKSSSWGPPDDGISLDGPGPLVEAAIEDGVANGRGGLAHGGLVDRVHGRRASRHFVVGEKLPVPQSIRRHANRLGNFDAHLPRQPLGISKLNAQFQQRESRR